MQTLNGNTAEDLKVWAKDNNNAAMMALAARAFAELEAERVKAYTMPIFAKYEFFDEDDGTRITDPKRLYHTGEDQDDLCAQYHAEVCAADRANGFDGPEGCCPAMIAHSLQIEAERALLLSFGEFSGVGDRFATGSLDIWAKTLDMALTVCMAEEIV